MKLIHLLYFAFLIVVLNPTLTSAKVGRRLKKKGEKTKLKKEKKTKKSKKAKSGDVGTPYYEVQQADDDGGDDFETLNSCTGECYTTRSFETSISKITHTQ